MRVTCAACVGLCLMGAAAAGRPDRAAGDASSILAAAREALGGEKKLSEVKSFVATGRTRQVRGNNLVPIEFEILCELPDKYLRKDEIPAQESEPTSSGFNGDALIQIPPPTETPTGGAKPAAPPPQGSAAAAQPPKAALPPAQAQTSAGQTPTDPAGRAGGPPPDPRTARVTALKQDFVKLTLGMFATSFSDYPLTFSQIGQAEAPQGKADILDVKGPGAFVLKLFINSDTHLPIMVSWTVPATAAVIVVPGQPTPGQLAPGSIVVQAPAPPAPTAPKAEQEQYTKAVQDLRRNALAGRLVEHRLYYADYRDIGNGLRFPFRIRRAVAGETVEETNFDRFAINRRIDPRRFEPVK